MQARTGVVRKALFARLGAKPGKEAEVAAFVRGYVSLVAREPETTAWFGGRLSRSTFAIFGVFPDDAGRSTHLANGEDRTQGPGEPGPQIFAAAPDIRMADVLAVNLCEDLVTRGLIVGLEARRHAGADVENVLRGVLPLAVEEPDTVGWFAVRFGPSTFALMAYFPDDAGRNSHRRGRVMGALAAMGPELLVGPPAVDKLGVVVAKLEALTPHSRRFEM